MPNWKKSCFTIIILEEMVVMGIKFYKSKNVLILKLILKFIISNKQSFNKNIIFRYWI